MKKTITLAAFAAILLVALAPDAFAKSPEELSSRAAIALKEGRLQEALELYQIVAKEWPEDPKYGAEAHLKVATCLAKLGKLEAAIDWCRETVARYPGHEKLVASAKQLEKEIRAHAAQAGRREEEERAVAEALAKLERSLKEKGLEGEELEREFAKGRQRLLEAVEKKRAAAAAERYGELWRDLGLTEEQLAERRRRFEELKARQAAMEAELQELRRQAERLKAARPEIERFRESAKAVREKEEEAWRQGREKDLEAARREFTELGKRLGIPPEAVERLLAEHGAHRHEPPRPEEAAGPARRMEELERHVGAMAERMHAMLEELNGRFGQVMERLERLEEEVRREK